MLPLAAPINHVLAQADWARERLKPFVGHAARFAVAPVDFTLAITDEGLVELAGEGRKADVSIRMSAGVAMRVLAGDETAFREAHIEGSVGFAQELAHLAANLRWDYEEDLSKLFGDVIAFRMGQGFRDFTAWQKQSAERVAVTTRDYLVQERNMIAPRDLIEGFVRDVDDLKDDVARFEKRLLALVKRR